ncbi:hypothetical protein L7F22_032992 [Adiantum nelumboides]|nr:hypothetical protein [Adiantum nelumboides]
MSNVVVVGVKGDGGVVRMGGGVRGKQRREGVAPPCKRRLVIKPIVLEIKALWPLEDCSTAFGMVSAKVLRMDVVALPYNASKPPMQLSSSWLSNSSSEDETRFSSSIQVSLRSKVTNLRPLLHGTSWTMESNVFSSFSFKARTQTHASSVESVVECAEIEATRCAEKEIEDLQKCSSPPPNWREVIQLIRQKAKHLKAIAEKLSGCPFNGQVPSTLDELLKLPGVGPKIALLVLWVAFGKGEEGFIVDTNVRRVCCRLGWAPDASDPNQVRLSLESWLPRSLWPDISFLFVGFGQQVCKAIAPHCERCLVNTPESKYSSFDKGMCALKRAGAGDSTTALHRDTMKRCSILKGISTCGLSIEEYFGMLSFAMIGWLHIFNQDRESR